MHATNVDNNVPSRAVQHEAETSYWQLLLYWSSLVVSIRKDVAATANKWLQIYSVFGSLVHKGYDEWQRFYWEFLLV